MTTYELMRQAEQILAQDYDSPEAMNLALERWADAQEDKLEAIRAVLHKLEAEAELMGTEEARFRDRRRLIERSSERIEAMALNLLLKREEMGLEAKVKAPTYSAWVAKVAVVVGPEDPALWPDAFTSIERKPNKAAALQALRGGESIDGLRLETKRYVRFK